MAVVIVPLFVKILIYARSFTHTVKFSLLCEVDSTILLLTFSAF